MNRFNKIAGILLKENIDGFIISNPVNRNYLSGFTGTSGILLCAASKNYFITDARYEEQAKREVQGAETVITLDYYEKLMEIIKNEKLKRVGFEFKSTAYNQYVYYRKMLGEKGLKEIKAGVEGLREFKDEEETALIKKATEISEIAFKKTLDFIKPGVSEKDVAAYLEYHMRRNGADGSSFTTIVASGERGALPHGVASDKKLKKGELIVIDFGAVYRGYCSDLTRTVGLGIIDKIKKTAYKVVYEAQQKAIKELVSGVKLSIPDKKARKILQKHSLDKYFVHGLGHGLGMEVHEKPVVSFKSEEIASAGMVVTAEPGVYFPGKFGIRIESIVVLTKNGRKVFGEDQKRLVML